jgi:hypothetical protein
LELPEGTAKIDCALARNAFTKEQLTLGFYEGVDVRRNPSAEAQLARAMEDRKQRKERRRALRDQQPDSQAGFHSDGGSDDDGRGDGKGLVAGRAAGKGMARVARHIDKKKFKAAKVWTMMDALSRRVAGVAGGAPKADKAVVKLDVGEVADGRGLCVRRGTDGGCVCAGEQMGALCAPGNRWGWRIRAYGWRMLTRLISLLTQLLACRTSGRRASRTRGWCRRHPLSRPGLLGCPSHPRRRCQVSRGA